MEGTIVGGTDRTIEQHPYQVGVFFNRSPSCGGSILNANTVLSAAHCTYGKDHSNFQVLAGQTDNRNSESLIDVVRVSEHPLYDHFSLRSDVVVLRLVSSLTFGPAIRPVVLPTSNHIVPNQADLVVTGWGALSSGGSSPNILQGVTIPAWTNAACQAAYTPNVILDQHLCAGAVGRDSCQGDSGGPVMHNGMQVGIVSWGESCAEQWPGVNARVTFFLGFISQEMNRP